MLDKKTPQCPTLVLYNQQSKMLLFILHLNTTGKEAKPHFSEVKTCECLARLPDESENELFYSIILFHDALL